MRPRVRRVMAKSSRIDSQRSPLKIHAAIAAASAAPSAVGDVQFGSGRYGRIRVFVDYGGTTLTALNLRVYVWNDTLAKFYRIVDSDDVEPLTPTMGALTLVDEARDFFVGRGSFVHVQVESIAGSSPSATVWVMGLDDGEING